MRRRNRSPAVTMTDEQRRAVDEVVLTAIRVNGSHDGVKMSEIRDVPVVMRALSNLPGAKPDHRYIGESLQRLKQAEQIHLVRGKWKTTSPTA